MTHCELNAIICRWQAYWGVQCGKRTLQRKKSVDNFLFTKWTQSKHFHTFAVAWLTFSFLRNGQWKQISNRQNYLLQDYFKNGPTRWGAQRQRGVWCSVADIWRNPAASPAASRWWGCDPCLSRSPEQRASHACATALWRPAIETERIPNSGDRKVQHSYNRQARVT